MNPELKVLKDKQKIDEWIDIALLSEPGDVELFRKKISKAVDNPDLDVGICFYFEQDNTIIATAFVNQTDYDRVRTKSVTISDVAVKKEFQKTGIGKKLILSLFDFIKKYDKNFVLVFTTVASDFYKKCGMIKWGSIPNFTVEGRTRDFLYKRFD